MVCLGHRDVVAAAEPILKAPQYRPFLLQGRTPVEV